MKRIWMILLVLMLALSLAACSGGGDATPPADDATPEITATDGPVAEEVRGVTIPAFAVQVNGVTVSQAEMADYPMYSVQSTSVNSSGTESITTYVGFALKDVLAAAGLTENYVWLEAIADDGYSVSFTGGLIYEDTTLLAMTKDGSPFAAAPWFAPCSDAVTGNYLKGTVTILVNTTEGAPEIDLTPAAGGTEGSALGELPEILDRTDKVEFADYAFLVNGVSVSNQTLEGLSIYKITATTENSSGEISESGYTGYQLADVLEACGLSGYATVKAVADDGYETELSEELIHSEYTLVAIEKDGEVGEDSTIWLAPCSESSARSYCKLVVEIVAE